ncbi:biotin/lipoyl-containing protein [Duncaniella muricolitica]|jgi:pyruvate carboxylase subunit B|uniref:biotin/lipoyl-containing protein n=1 Tax=Duncaniella muricolitica TaxID=2880704 RepID=UPI00244DF936|nr:biotin/lipoyl-containing protein [Duncaniella muricolitica]
MAKLTRPALKIRDLTLRDGQQSLFATRMNQETIDKLLPYYEDAHFYIMEVWGGAVPDSVMRYLDESPWDRLRIVSKAMDSKSEHPKALLSALSRGRNLFGYVPYPDSVLEGFYKEAIDNGLNVMRIFDALNDIDNVRESIRLINQLGGIADGAVCYTVDPKAEAPEQPSGFMGKLKSMFGNKPKEPEKIFTDDYFVSKAKAMEALGAKIITLKDMAGLVNPLRAASIISALKSAVKVPVDFHTHCTPGYGLASSLMAIIKGVDILDTNIWWFGGGSAAPAIELIYIFCQRLGVEVEANMEAVGRIRKELFNARKALADFDLNRDKMPIEFDPLNDTLPAEVAALFDTAIQFAFADDEEGLLETCHKIEAYFNFPKPNELVKNAEVPGGMYSNMVAQLKQLKSEDLLEDAMRLIPMVRRDAGLIPLVTPTSQIVGSQAVLVALDRKNGKPDYTTTNNQFISLVKGEYGKTPVAIDPTFREKITGSPEEKAYDVSSYKRPQNPVLEDMGGMPLASNNEEMLLLELLPSVANGFLRKRRAEEYEARRQDEAASAPVAEVVEEETTEPITGPTLVAPMGGRIISVNVKDGQTVKKGDLLLVYEAMKMENDVEAEKDDVVKRVLVSEGDVVSTNAPLIEFQD